MKIAKLPRTTWAYFSALGAGTAFLGYKYIIVTCFYGVSLHKNLPTPIWIAIALVVILTFVFSWLYLVHFPISIRKTFDEIARIDNHAIPKEILEQAHLGVSDFKKVIKVLESPFPYDSPAVSVLKERELRKWKRFDTLFGCFLVLCTGSMTETVLLLVFVTMLIKQAWHAIGGS